ncbi:ubiquinone biosynthesis hydrox [Athelia psychrophila]|uniref:Ubiquinone biosynthesis monooxygenase COQ6, mitochondrial n=1 Tax=Athelia psychrophila TaxID=1759441 RepID=A0A166TF35_9AGAM|nr:ubiquinone biosynthesis hydrox [Fibularhizoctonia sp. CBS 109695]
MQGSKALRLSTNRKLTSSLKTALVRGISTAEHGPVEETDIVIVGGGPAGLALATALGASNSVRDSLKICLVEAGDLGKVRNWAPAAGTYSNRVSSLTNASQAFLEDIGAWDYVDESRTMPVEEMQVWDGVSDARIVFNASDLSPSTLQMARLTENLNLQRALLARLATLPHVQLLDNTKVASISSPIASSPTSSFTPPSSAPTSSTAPAPTAGWPIVHLSTGRTLRARLLIGADGFNSPVRSYAGITAHGWAYPTQAIVATLSHAPPSTLMGANTVAYQRFLPTGPIAFLPLSETSSSLVWSTTPALAKALLACEDAEKEGVLRAMVNAAFRLPDVSMRHLHNVILESQSHGGVSAAQIEEEIAFRERAHAIDARSPLSSLSPSSRGYGEEDVGSLPPLITGIHPNTAASFPLRYNHADAYIGEGPGARTVLVGDAAHTVHPLAGQGLNMGLGDVQALVEAVEGCVEVGGDAGSYTALLPYARARYAPNHTLMSAVDKLHKVYSPAFSAVKPVVWGRSVGLEVLNELDAVKGAIMGGAGARVSTRASSASSFKASPQEGAGGWEVAARGGGGLAAGVEGMKLVGSALAGAVLGGVQSLLKNVPPTGDRRGD